MKGPYVPILRKNTKRRGPLKLTTWELPPALILRMKAHGKRFQIPLRTIGHAAIEQYLDQHEHSSRA